MPYCLLCHNFPIKLWNSKKKNLNHKCKYFHTAEQLMNIWSWTVPYTEAIFLMENCFGLELGEEKFFFCYIVGNVEHQQVPNIKLDHHHTGVVWGSISCWNTAGSRDTCGVMLWEASLQQSKYMQSKPVWKPSEAQRPAWLKLDRCWCLFLPELAARHKNLILTAANYLHIPPHQLFDLLPPGTELQTSLTFSSWLVFYASVRECAALNFNARLEIRGACDYSILITANYLEGL